MPMADTTALLFTSSLFIPLLGVILLRESVGPYRWLAIVAGFVGVIIVSNPTGDIYVLGVLTALGAAMVHAILQILLRYLGPYESPETISFYFFAIGIFVAALPMPWVATVPSLDDVPLLLGVGLSGTGAQWLLSIAYRHAAAAVVTVFNYSQIIWSTLFGWLIWNDWPLPNVMLGAAVVIASNILIIWRESRLGRVSETNERAKF
jgi:drug/metabolite transporter (DMT)-like permease